MKINHYKKEVASFAWLIVIIVVSVFAWKNEPQFDSSLMALLPTSDQAPLVQKATDQLAGGFENKLILMLSGDSDNKVRKAVSAAAQSFSALSAVNDISWKVDHEMINLLEEEWTPFRYSIVAPDIALNLASGNYTYLKQKALYKAMSPLSAGGSLIEDPFGFVIERLNQKQKIVNVEPNKGLLRVIGVNVPSYLLVVSFNQSVFNSDLQRDVLDRLDALEAKISIDHVYIQKSGMILHAAAGAKQANKEMRTIGVGSLLGILVCVLLVFRKWSSFLLLLLPVAIGSSVAAAVCILVFPKVHLITFAFGAGLVGVSIDYSLHYLCERQVTSNARTLQKTFPGLVLGLLTSVIAYLAQALAPFPGLQQMAVFSVVGLCSAWVTVVLWLPLLTKRQAERPLNAALWLHEIRDQFPRLELSRVLKIGMFAVMSWALLIIWNTEKNIDVHSLQTSPDGLLNEDRSVQTQLGMASSAQFLLVLGESIEDSLQREESIRLELDDIVSKGGIEGYRALSQVLPSEKIQHLNYQNTTLLYEKALPDLYSILGLPEELYFQTLKKLLEQEGVHLTYSKWQQFDSSAGWRDLLVRDGSQVATAILFKGELSSRSKELLSLLADRNKDVVFVDRLSNISKLLQQYQAQISLWLLVAYLVISILLWFRYRAQLWRVILPPLFASLVALSFVAYFEQGINIFNLMAVILVVGIGLDMGIFLFENDEASHTWLATSLSCYTSLVAFGLLAMSSTPVLHHFGITVLLGLFAVWFISPLTRCRKSHNFRRDKISNNE